MKRKHKLLSKGKRPKTFEVFSFNNTNKIYTRIDPELTSLILSGIDEVESQGFQRPSVGSFIRVGLREFVQLVKSSDIGIAKTNGISGLAFRPKKGKTIRYKKVYRQDLEVEELKESMEEQE